MSWNDMENWWISFQVTIRKDAVMTYFKVHTRHSPNSGDRIEPRKHSCKVDSCQEQIVNSNTSYSEYLIRILEQKPGILTEAFHSFPQSFRVNVKIKALYISRFLPYIFKLVFRAVTTSLPTYFLWPFGRPWRRNKLMIMMMIIVYWIFYQQNKLRTDT
jgi:hypothetical protein